MPDNRVNLQTNQSFEGNAVNDGNGWPTPLVNPAGTLSVKIEDGKRGSQTNIQAMSTSRQNDVSLPEGRSKVQGVNRTELSVSIKKTVGDSLA